MRIIAIADTHIKNGSILECLPQELVAMLRGADIVIHAGDFVTRNTFDELSSIAELQAVHGNMDDTALKDLLPERAVLELEGIKIGIVHEAALSLHDLTGARYMAKEMGVEVLVFGHIHRPIIDKSDVLLVCPGSPTAPRLSEPSAIELVVERGKVSGKVVTFKGTACSALVFQDTLYKYY